MDLTNLPISNLPPPTIASSSWRQTGDGAGRRMEGRLNTTFYWNGIPYPCIFGESPVELDIFSGGGGTNETGTKRISALKSSFPAPGQWPKENDYITIEGKTYQINTIAGNDDSAHPWIIYKAASNP